MILDVEAEEDDDDDDEEDDEEDESIEGVDRIRNSEREITHGWLATSPS